MGKNNKEDKYEVFGNKKSILEEKKRIEQKLRQVTIPCSHTNAKGKLKVDFIGKDGALAECQKCGVKFSFEQIDLDKLDKSIMVVHNALNQIKAFSNDPEAEHRIIKQLGELDYNLSELRELYKRAVGNYGKGNNKNKNKNRNRDDFGSYGVGQIGFGGRRR